MASFLDLGILTYMAPMFVFFFLFFIIWAVLEKVELFSKIRGLNMLIAFLVSLIAILTPELVEAITLATPWFVLLLIFLFVLLLVFMFTGVSAEDIGAQFKEKTVVWIVLLVCLGIFGYALTQVYGEQVHAITSGEPIDGEEGGLMQTIGEILFHPRVMGALFIMILASQAVRLISAKAGS